MKLTDVFMKELTINPDLSANSAKLSSTRKSEGNSFDDYFNKTAKQEYDNSANERRAQEAKKSNVKRKETAAEQSSNDKATQKKSEASESDEVTDKKVEKEDGQEVSKKEATEETAATKEVAEDEETMTEAEDKLLGEISEILDIPKEVLEQLLAELNMKPADLLEQGNLSEFLQSALSADSPVELLKVPDMKEMLSDIRQALSEFADETKAEKLVMNTALAGEETATAKPTETAGKETSILKSVVTADDNGKKADLAETAQEKSETVKTAAATVATDSSTAKNTFGSGEGSAKNSDFAFAGNTDEIVGAQVQARQTSTATEFASKLTRAESTRNLNPSDVIRQMTDNLKTNLREGVSELRMILKPESLGEVTLKVMIQNGVVTAEFVAKSERVKEIIESNFNTLKDTLLQQGISVSELSVSVGNQDSNERMDQYMKERKKSSARISQIIGAINSDETMAEIDQSEILENEVDYMA